MRATTADAYRLLDRGAEALARAEWQGMRVDVEYCERMKRSLTKRLERETEKFEETKFARHWRHVFGGKYNPQSDTQLSHMLYDRLGHTPPNETDSGQGATDEETLRMLGMPELEHLIRTRKLRKLRDTYLDSFIREQRNGELHPFFNLHTVHSYRSSCDRPNFQNIPEHDDEAKQICQGAIYPRPGHKIKKADFSSLEAVISACYNKDPEFIKYLTDPSSDMHGDSARDLFILDAIDRKAPEHEWLRFCAKNSFVFAQFYGSYYADCAIGLAQQIKLPTSGRWKPGTGVLLPGGYNIADHFAEHDITSFAAFEDRVKEAEHQLWDVRFPVYRDWRKDWYARYERRGYFDMLSGFRCSGAFSRNQTWNLPVQGAGFHCLLWSFIRVDEIMREERWESRLIGEVHDDMMLDVYPPEEEHVDEVIQHVVNVELPKAWPWIIVPLRIKIKTGPVDGSLYTVG